MYAKVLPEIQKFEEKLMGFSLTIDQSNKIIRKFDENLTHKSDKVALKEIRAYVDATFAQKEV